MTKIIYKPVADGYRWRGPNGEMIDWWRGHLCVGFVPNGYGIVPPDNIRLCEAIALPAPDWSEAPKWAEWWAVDPDGICNWFSQEPILDQYTTARDVIGPRWSHVGSKQAIYDAINIPLGVDWRLLKVQRTESN